MSEDERENNFKMVTKQGCVPMHFKNWAHVYRQISATIAASLLSVSAGMTFGVTAVLLPQLQNDSTFPYEQGYDSWIASISPLAMMLGCLFSGNMSDGLGRRRGQLILIVPFMLGWTIMGFSTNTVWLLVSRFLVGITTGAIRPNTMVYIGEVTDPRYRQIALLCPSLALHVGVLVSHLVVKYVYWKTSGFIFVIPNIVTFIILLFLRESPLWLLHKGKIDEGIESFRLFRGKGENAEAELTAVLDKCKETTSGTTTRELLQITFSKPFMKCLLTTFFLFVASQWCGVNTLSFYAQEIFDNTFFGAIDVYLLIIVIDCIRIAAGIFICLVAKIMPQKLTFIVCCFVTSIVLVPLILYVYFKPAGLVWIAVTAMVVFIAAASIVTNMSWSFVAEIFPAKVRGFGSGLSSGISFGLLFISVKVTPEVSKNFGTAVLYAGFSIVTLICGAILIFTLPETNGKSLQEIENELYDDKNKSKDNVVPKQEV